MTRYTVSQSKQLCHTFALISVIIDDVPSAATRSFNFADSPAELHFADSKPRIEVCLSLSQFCNIPSSIR